MIAVLAWTGAAIFFAAAAQPRILETPEEVPEIQIVGQLPVYCGPHASIAAILRGAGGQMKVSDGATINGTRLELYRGQAPANQGLWTVVMSWPDGGACILATGDSWANRTVPPTPENSH
ncbi:MAG TPA: hypothetical protein DCS82_02585 [Rhodospirillaceae bacterium]|nr:hypothetical protein [Rhodospirillaceae bacterium]HAA93860.1 hypothetical protein [Rhodospirillaceae bacterium]HAT34576.1 hypothetical protein [Rhodospirillaceae bacterium]